MCVNTRTSYHCQCRDGYSLAADGRSCEGVLGPVTVTFPRDWQNIVPILCSILLLHITQIDGLLQCLVFADVDECSLGTDSCHQLCINVIGSYHCDCEEGYALNSDGRTCRISCGGNYTGSNGSFHTPGWPTSYPLDFRCKWYINSTTTSSNFIISLAIDSSHYGVHGTPPCSGDYLQLYDGNTTVNRSLGVFCGLISPDIQYTSSNQAVVVFNSGNIRQQSNRAGARITYQLFELGMQYRTLTSYCRIIICTFLCSE